MAKNNEFKYFDNDWYEPVYNDLGSNWLLRSLNKLELRQNYIFVSLSANAALYEKEVYDAHKNEFDPIFYVGDLFASEVNNPAESADNFIYIKGDNNAVSKNYTIQENAVDVILDCKGALWHFLKYANKEKTIELLNNYISLLNKEGKLLIDQYKHTYLQLCIGDLQKSGFLKADSGLDYFAERSTYCFLEKRMKKMKITDIVKPLYISQKDEGKSLSDKMDVACITKENLIVLLDGINSSKLDFSNEIW